MVSVSVMDCAKAGSALDHSLPILAFQPLLKRARWGGRRLGTVLHKRLGSEIDYAESWELCDLGTQQTSVQSGPYADWTLERLVEFRRRELLGPDSQTDQFPLLIKYLDAQDRLSVQVHPNDGMARRLHNHPRGKTEAWLILEAEPGSELFVGLKEGVTEAAFRRHLAAGTVAECLHRFPARVGQCVLVPAGTVHAIGEGIVLAEVQQSSDLTYRLDDWGRVDADGQPRPLQIAAGLECLDFERGPVLPVVPRRLSSAGPIAEQLAECDYFSMVRYSGSGPWCVPDDGQLHIVLVVHGSATVQASGQSALWGLGSTLVLPAVREDVVWHCDENTVLLDVIPGKCGL